MTSTETITRTGAEPTLEELLELKREAAVAFDNAVAAYKAHAELGDFSEEGNLESDRLAMEREYRKGVLARAVARFLAATLAE
jgi:hypothetical protein